MKTNALSFSLIIGTLCISTQVAPAHSSIEKKDIIIAIIDTGVDVNHPYIKNHLWTNSQEKNNLKDNDGNGYAGDFHGWNFSNNSADLADKNGHGTHIAGIILQQISSSRVKLMILKYYDDSATGAENLANSVRAIRYATEMGADIINYSGGGDFSSPLEEQAIKDAERKGILFVAAAGNDGRNTDEQGYYPAGYRLSNIIAVAAMDSQQQLLSTSNYGSHSVDIVAPGKDIFSSLPNEQFGFMTGTSQATAWVSGLAAQIMSFSSFKVKPVDLKRLLVKQAKVDKTLTAKLRYPARLTQVDPLLN